MRILAAAQNELTVIAGLGAQLQQKIEVPEKITVKLSTVSYTAGVKKHYCRILYV